MTKLNISQVFSAALIYGHWGISPSRLGLQIREVPFESKDHDGHDTKHSNEKSERSTSNGESTTIGHTTGANSDVVNNSARIGHAAHTHGLAPTHEATTTESGIHVQSTSYGGREV